MFKKGKRVQRAEDERQVWAKRVQDGTGRLIGITTAEATLFSFCWIRFFPWVFFLFGNPPPLLDLSSIRGSAMAEKARGMRMGVDRGGVVVS